MKTIKTLLVAMTAAAVFGCSGGELTDNASPVELVANTSQNLHQLSINGGDGCEQPVGTVEFLAIPKNPTSTGDFLDVRVQRYRVSYVRTDGGTAVPASFTRSADTLVTAGGGPQSFSSFLIVQPGAYFQSPFAALQTGDGRDPVTRQPFVRMDVIIEFFGETLGGDNVKTTTRFSLDFCVSCGCF
ncbi:MAG TPA: hypothetical protein VF618_12795 [Thermoanaerobaculia bacterium]